MAGVLVKCIGCGLLRQRVQIQIGNNGRGFEYPKGKTPRFGWRFILSSNKMKTPITANPVLPVGFA